jgi:hypothetical protein
MRIETSTNEKTGMVTAKIEHTGMTVQIGIDGRVFIRPADGAATLSMFAHHAMESCISGCLDRN